MMGNDRLPRAQLFQLCIGAETLLAVVGRLHSLLWPYTSRLFRIGIVRVLQLNECTCLAGTLRADCP